MVSSIVEGAFKAENNKVNLHFLKAISRIVEEKLIQEDFPKIHKNYG